MSKPRHTLPQRIAGKWQALSTLGTQLRYFKNGMHVFRAFRAAQPLPPLQLRCGLTLFHGPADNAWSLFREIFVERCYTRGAFYSPAPADCVMDLGANIGFFAAYLQCQAPGIEVHCFEPVISTRQRLQQNVVFNRLEEHIFIHPFGVFAQDGRLQIHLSDRAVETSMFTEGKIEEVECVSLRRAIQMTKRERIDLLKIDVEGAEIEILESAGSDEFANVCRIVLEYHELLRPGCRDRVIAALKRHYSRVEHYSTAGDGGLGIARASR